MEQKKRRTATRRSGRTKVKTTNVESSATTRGAEEGDTFGERDGALSPPADEAVRTRAYYLFLERGGRSGHELDDWLRAESEIRH